jgi:hypothetical protein
VKRV